MNLEEDIRINTNQDRKAFHPKYKVAIKSIKDKIKNNFLLKNKNKKLIKKRINAIIKINKGVIYLLKKSYLYTF